MDRLRRPHQNTIFLLALVLGFSLGAESASSNKLAVDSAVADVDEELMLISGRGFVGHPRVWLLDQGELLVLSVSPHRIEARLPSTVAAGTYRLIVSMVHRGQHRSQSSRTDSIDVTIGATGPAGAPGQDGMNGADGLPGPPGPPGDAGAPGADGDAGAAGRDGATWLGDSGAPEDALGNDGDFYLDFDTGDTFQREGGAWAVRLNLEGEVGPAGPRGPEGAIGPRGLPGVQGSQGVPGLPGSPGAPGPPGPAGARGASWTSGAGAPSPLVGLDGDFYLDIDTGNVYVKMSRGWSVVANITGPAGPPGLPVNTSDPVASLANRLGIERSIIGVPREALRSAQCVAGDQVSFQASDAAVGRVVGFWGAEGLNELFEFHILLSAGPGLTNNFVGGAGRLQLTIAGSALDATGVVTAFAGLGSDTEGSLYVATLRSELSHAADAIGFDVYHDSKPEDVIQSELTRLGIPAAVNVTGSSAPGHVVQWNESDLQFIQRIAEEAGLFFFTREDGTVVVADRNDAFSTGPSLPYLGPFADPGSSGLAVSSLAAGAAATTQQVRVLGWDYVSKEVVEGQSASGSGFVSSLVFDSLSTTTSGAQRSAQIRYERARVEANERQGTSNAPSLRAGRQVSIQGVGGGFGGMFYVASVQHVVHPDEDGGCFAYGNQFIAVPVSVPFRPARVTPRPVVAGLHTALVSNTNDPEELGRVKVVFPWGDGGLESDWARVAFSSGQTTGWTLPEIEDEVLVGFIGGDPRAPVIIGGLFNGVDKPPTNP